MVPRNHAIVVDVGWARDLHEARVVLVEKDLSLDERDEGVIVERDEGVIVERHDQGIIFERVCSQCSIVVKYHHGGWKQYSILSIS